MHFHFFPLNRYGNYVPVNLRDANLQQVIAEMRPLTSCAHRLIFSHLLRTRKMSCPEYGNKEEEISFDIF